MKELIASLITRVQILEMQLEAQDRIAMAIALSFDMNKRLEIVRALQALQLNAVAKDGIDAGKLMQGFIERLLAVSEPDGIEPLEALLTEALLFARTKPEHKEALTTWLATGSADEIAEDLKEVLQPLLNRPSKPDADAKKGTARKGRKPGADGKA